MLGQLTTTLGEILTMLLGWLTSVMSGIVPIFYETETGFTFFGLFLLIGLGLFFVMFAWRVIQGFIRR